MRGGGQGVAAEHGGGPGWSRLAKLGLTSDKITIDEAKWLFFCFFQMGVGVALMWVPPPRKKGRTRVVQVPLLWDFNSYIYRYRYTDIH